MTIFRALVLAIATALAIEAGIYYGLVALDTGEDLIVEIEMIWLCLAAFLGVAFVDHFDHTEEEQQKRHEPRSR